MTFLNLVLLYLNVLFLSFVRHFTTLKWLKALKLSKICLKMIKAIMPKTTEPNIWFLNARIRFNLHCRFNEYCIKLQIIINIYL